MDSGEGPNSWWDEMIWHMGRNAFFYGLIIGSTMAAIIGIMGVMIVYNG